jgi:hypothetical protein
VYARVDGQLPLDDVRKAGRPEVAYLQADIQVVQAGPVELRLTTTEPITFWVDEDQFDQQAKAIVPLTPGRHRLTVRIPAGSGPAPTLQVELHRPSDSQANFEVVNGGE